MMSSKGVVGLISVCMAASIPLLTLPQQSSAAAPKKAAPKKGAPGVKTVMPAWSRNLNIPARSWLPVERPKEVLLCVHGLGFSSKSFTAFGRQMALRGIAVYAVDVRGFGHWINKRGESTLDFEACLVDIENLLKVLRKNYPTAPVILVGESMGGALVLAATSRNPALVDGLISAVPSSDRYAKVSKEIWVGAHYLEDRNEAIDMSTEIVNKSTDDLALRERMKAEPLNKMQLTPAELKQFQDFMKGNNDAAALIEKNHVLLLAGFKDKLVKPEGTIELFNEIPSDDKLLMVVGDGEHLILEENQMSQQLEDLLVVWIRDQSRSWYSRSKKVH